MVHKSPVVEHAQNCPKIKGKQDFIRSKLGKLRTWAVIPGSDPDAIFLDDQIRVFF